MGCDVSLIDGHMEKRMAVLRCEECDLKHNLQVLYDYQIEIVSNVPCTIGNGGYFYLVMYDKDILKDVPLKGTYL